MIVIMNGQKMTQIDIEQALLGRIPDGWGKYVSCRKGWYKILEDLDSKLSYLDPNYRVVQIKEKFGTLRFYFDSSLDNLVKDIMNDCVAAAQYASSYTCEYCGSRLTAKLREGGWVKTLCDDCSDKRNNE